MRDGRLRALFGTSMSQRPLRTHRFRLAAVLLLGVGCPCVQVAPQDGGTPQGEATAAETSDRSVNEGSVQDGPIGLAELPALARARAARQRPVLEDALAPALVYLELEYGRNREVLDEKIASIAQLGDGIAPLLIDYLTPRNESRKARHLAGNAARVLAHMDLQAFLPTLLELADDSDPVARRNALWLLGHVDHPAAVRELSRALDRHDRPQEQQIVIESALRIGTPVLRDDVTPLLASPEPELRATVLRYLIEHDDGSAAATVLDALRSEAEPVLYGLYVRYLERYVHEDEAAADVLVGLLRGTELGPDHELQVLDALATIAPHGHEATGETLAQIVRSRKAVRYRIAAARTLEELGDRRARRVLLGDLEERIRQDRDSAQRYEDRALAHFAFEDYTDAIRDYERAIHYTRLPARNTVFYIQIARCEAHRGNERSMLRALREAKASAERIRAEAAGDPVFLEALRDDSVQRFLESLDK